MKKIVYERKGRISHIVLNQPQRRNSVDDHFMNDMRNSCIKFKTDADAWVLIISATGDHFSVGADLLKGIPSVKFAQRSIGMLPSTLEIWKPTIAAIKGYCVGGGWMIAQDCDLRVASYDSKIGIPEVRWNFIPPFCAGFTHHHLATNISLERILSGSAISGQRAYEIGFVNRVVSKEKVMQAAIGLAEKMCAMGLKELMERKKSFYRSMEQKMHGAS